MCSRPLSKNGVASGIFGRHMQKGLPVAHLPDYILYIVW